MATKRVVGTKAGGAKKEVPSIAKPTRTVQLGSKVTLEIEDDAPAPPKTTAPPVEETFSLDAPPAPPATTVQSPHAFTQIVSNVKGGFDLRLAPLTAIVGKNRSRKTAVLDALRLALTGTHPIGGQSSRLMELVPRSEEKLQVKLLARDSTVTFEVTGTRASAKAPAWEFAGQLGELSPEQRGHLVPNIALADLLKLSPAEARRAVFLRWGKLEELAAPSYLSPGQLEKWGRGTDAALQGEVTLTEALTELPAIFRKAKLEHGRLAKAAAQEAEGLRGRLGALGTPVGVEDLGQLQNQHAAQLQVEEARRAEQAVLTEIEAFKEELQRVPREVPPEEPEPARVATMGVEPGLREQVERDRQKVALLTELVQASQRAECCALCRRGPVDSTLLEAVKARLRDGEAKLSAAPRIESSEHHAWAERMRVRQRVLQAQEAAKFKHAALGNRLATAQAARAQAEQLFSLAGFTEEVPAATLLSQLGQARAARELRELLREREETARREELAGEDFKVLEKEAGLLLQKVLEEVVAEAETAVTRYLPVSFDVKLRLEEAGKPVCRWEIVGTDGEPHATGAASGSEDVLLLVALACAWTEDAPVRVVLLDDRELGLMDPVTLKETLEFLAGRVKSGVLTQVVVAWTRPEEIPAGWTVVKT